MVERDAAQHGRGRFWLWLGLIALGSLGLELWLAGTSTLWDRDEPRYARAAVEMLATGGWLVPTFNGDLRLYKPSGIYWAMLPGVWLLGATEVGVRLASCVGFASSVFMTGVVGRWLGREALGAGRLALGEEDGGEGLRGGDRIGLWSAFVVATSLLGVVLGHLSISDGVLLMGCTLGWLAATARLLRGGGWGWWVAYGVGITVGQYVKGPVAIAAAGLPVLGLLAWMWWRSASIGGPRDRAAARTWVVREGVWWLGVTLVSLGLFALWAIPANIATDGAFKEVGLDRHVGYRMFNPMEGHGGEGWVGYLVFLVAFYPAVVAVGMFPWVLILPAAVRAWLGGRLGRGEVETRNSERESHGVVGWWLMVSCVPFLVMLSFVATKLPHYALPAWPALAVGVALMVERSRAGALAENDAKWLRAGQFFFGAVNLGLAVLIGVGPWLAWWVGLVESWVWPALGTVLGVLMIGWGEVAVRRIRKERAAEAGRWVGVGGAALIVLMTLGVLPVAEEGFKPAASIAAAVRADGGDAAVEEVVTIGYREGSLIFYLDRSAENALPMPDTGAGTVRRWAAGEWGQYLLTRQALLEEAGVIDADGTTVEGVMAVGSWPILNYAKGAEVKRLVLVRRGPGQ
ncbi:MAG: glycosyltransferase family 39 protein [Planctomycetota bacterium]